MENCYENKCGCGNTYYGEKRQPMCPPCYDKRLRAAEAELELVHSLNKSQFERINNLAGENSSLLAKIEAAEKQEPAEFQYQSRDGSWNSFSSEKHRIDTIDSGEWNIRKLYTLPPMPAAETKQEVGKSDKRISLLSFKIANCIFKLGDDARGKTTRLQFIGGQYPDKEFTQGGINKLSLADHIKQVIFEFINKEAAEVSKNES